MKVPAYKFRLTAMAIALIAVGGMFHLVSAVAAAMTYSDAAFQAAQASGAPILVEVHANWCPTCKAQAPIIDQLTSQDKFKSMKVFRVDFDSQKSEVRKFGAQMQSTLIVFKGKLEVGRSVGDTKRDSIAALLDKGL